VACSSSFLDDPIQAQPPKDPDPELANAGAAAAVAAVSCHRWPLVTALFTEHMIISSACIHWTRVYTLQPAGCRFQEQLLLLVTHCCM
jgi:hypothetical protein